MIKRVLPFFGITVILILALMVFGATITYLEESHGLDMGTVDSSAAIKGFLIRSNQTHVYIQNVTKHVDGTVTKCYLWDNSKTEVASGTFSGVYCTFNTAVNLTPNIDYYLLTDKDGAGYDDKRQTNMGGSLPVTSGYISWMEGYHHPNTLNETHNIITVGFFLNESDAPAPSPGATVSLRTPANGLSSQLYQNFTFNVTGNLSYCKLYTNTTGNWNNISIIHNVNESFAPYNFTGITYPTGDYIWNVWCNDSVWASSNFSFSYQDFIFKGVNYTFNIVENNQSPIWINYSINPALTVTSSGIIYNNTAYTGQNIVLTANHSSNRTMLTPTLTADGSIYFNWTIILSSGYQYNSSTYEQAIDIYDQDNCSTYTNPYLNYTFYRNANTRTTADSSVNLTLDYGFKTSTFQQYFWTSESQQLCYRFSQQTSDVSGTIKYISDWTDMYIYTQNINTVEANQSPILYYNLTVPKLYLNFSEKTDITVITAENVSYYEQVDLLIAMTDLPEGKVTVKFNDDSQSYIYNNEHDTYVEEFLEIIEDADSYDTFRVQDESYNILDDARVRVWELNYGENDTKLIGQYYGDTDYKLFTEGNKTYKMIAYKDGYTHVGEFTLSKGDEYNTGETKVITMRPIAENESISTYLTVSNKLRFYENNTPLSYPFDVVVDTTDTISALTIEAYFNGGNVTITPQTYTNVVGYHTTPLRFYAYHENMTITVTADSAVHTFFIDKVIMEERYEGSYYRELLYSKLAFFIFFMVAVTIGISVQQRFRDYGIFTFLFIGILFSFFNVYMWVPSIMTAAGLIIKRVVSE